MAELELLARRIGYTFKSIELLDRSLTHSSLGSGKTNRKREPLIRSNERLEFLGDRVLGLVIADWLLENYPDQKEGELAPKLNALVRKETCAQVAQDIELGVYLRLGRGEERAGGRDKLALLGDAMEALIAAVYCDGGLEHARVMILQLWAPYFDTLGEMPKDAKTALQEWAQGRALPTPEYSEQARSGPDHEPVFVMAVSVDGLPPEVAQGPSKRAAEQAAAEALLRRERVW
ncbi:MAG: ribonuclease III [Hyphomicrobiales bacterium]